MPENKPMDPQQAISLLDQVCAQVSLTRENHQRVLVAVGCLKQALRPPTIKDPDPASKTTSQEGQKNGKVPQETIEASAKD